MMNSNHSRPLLLAVLTVSMNGAIHAAELEEDPYYGGKLSIRVVDEEGRPVDGAIAGFSAIRWTDGTWKVACNPDVTRTNAEGIVELPKGMKLLGYDDRSLVALHEDRKLIGVVPAKQTHPDEHGVVTVPITSACHVTGSLTCNELTSLDHSIGWAIVFVHDGQWRPFGHASEQQKFEFWLPTGEYELQAYGTKLHEARQKIRIEDGQVELIVPPIDLPAVRVALLEGQPAPELRDVAGWKNSEPLELVELRGKYVLLNFWGHWCGPCIAHMPRLLDVYERYGRDELEIVGVHVGSKEESVESAEQLDKLLAEVRTEHWAGRDVPFPVALCRSQQTQHFGTADMARSIAAADYGVVGYPTTILIGPDGKIIGTSEVDAALHADSWDKLDRLLRR